MLQFSAWFSIIAIIVGLLIWFIPAKPESPNGAKRQETGKWMYVAGLFAFLLANASKVLTLFQ